MTIGLHLDVLAALFSEGCPTLAVNHFASQSPRYSCDSVWHQLPLYLGRLVSSLVMMRPRHHLQDGHSALSLDFICVFELHYDGLLTVIVLPSSIVSFF